jgi:hypothetical protein
MIFDLAHVDPACERKPDSNQEHPSSRETFVTSWSEAGEIIALIIHCPTRTQLYKCDLLVWYAPSVL